MKMFRSLLLLTGIILFMASCEKEYSLEGGLTPAAGTLKANTFGDCLPSTVNGIYKKDTLLNSLNYIEVQLNFTSGGTYTIGSDTLNGYFFLGTGIITAPGLQTVKLFAIGKPFNAGTDNFTISYRNTQCFIAVTVVGPGGGTAAYTLGSTAGACTAAALAGTYKAGLATSASNTATINVNVTTIGSYSITTTTVNGVTFTKSGNFTALGAQTVVLQASGTPAAAGTFSYPVSGSASTCSLSVTYTAASSAAVFSLQGAPASCTAAVVSGTYAVGTAMTSSNTVTIQATVTTAGTYSVSTNAINGISFSASGVFSGTGTQPIVLVAVGTPTAGGALSFTPQAGTSACMFTVTVTSPAPTDYITCKLNGLPATFNDSPLATFYDTLGVKSVIIDGFTGNNPTPYMGLLIASLSNITAGTYTVNQLAANKYVAAEYDDASGKSYTVESDSSNQAQNPAFTIVITSLTATRVVGTFTGPVKDNNGAGPGLITITEGKFDVPIQ